MFETTLGTAAIFIQKGGHWSDGGHVVCKLEEDDIQAGCHNGDDLSFFCPLLTKFVGPELLSKVYH